ncbi:Asp-tRNA(Asn)/Glu-tRNA(Gln) amidotransferase GatCAB subunit A [Candidatus Campbellbacteria bacterium]|nr:MAG: Asp-tRNA(Asn)/Glu-tRNA(Gln) amidotransferase GatCAB subunit A [Candidatus Campbellbacteria bacterium]
MNIDLKNLDIPKISQMLQSKELTVKELTDFCLENIKAKNEELNVFLFVFENIDEQVENAEKMFAEGKQTVLTGIPVAVKANILIQGQNANAGSKILEKYKATYDATVIEKLKEQGAIFLGYLNQDEFACGGSTENSAFGVTKNPLDTTRVPGGSSGGTAAAVAADMCVYALGTDTGGSVRQPAAFCGLVGVKPTYGRVSRHGAVAMGSSLDQICPITRNIKDSEIVLDAISGKDSFDMTTISKDNFLEKEVKLSKKIAVPFSFINQIKDQKVLDNFNQSLEILKQKGYEVEDINLDIFKYALPIYYVLMPAELSSNLARYDGIRYGNKKEGQNLQEEYVNTKSSGFGEEIKRRIILGTYVLSAGYENQYYNKANALREQIKAEFKKVIDKYDAVLMPTTPSYAFKLGQNKNDPIEMYLSDIFTVTANIIGNPALSVPSGMVQTEEGNKMPLSLQILTDFGEEKKAYKIAEDFLS